MLLPLNGLKDKCYIIGYVYNNFLGQDNIFQTIKHLYLSITASNVSFCDVVTARLLLNFDQMYLALHALWY